MFVLFTSRILLMKREKAAAEVCSPKLLIDAGSGTYEHEAKVTVVIQSSNLLPLRQVYRRLTTRT